MPQGRNHQAILHNTRAVQFILQCFNAIGWVTIRTVKQKPLSGRNSSGKGCTIFTDAKLFYSCIQIIWQIFEHPSI